MAIDGGREVSAAPVPPRGGHGPLVLMLVLMVVFMGLVVGLYVTHSTTRVSGPSMEPTILPEDILLVTRGYDRPLRGDVIVMSEPGVPDGEPLVKRVIGVAGDSISVTGGQAIVNGAPERGAYTVFVAGGDINIGLVTVKDDSVWVLGDNRPVSQDSRIFGSVPLDSVQGRVVAIIAPIHRMAFVD